MPEVKKYGEDFRHALTGRVRDNLCICGDCYSLWEQIRLSKVAALSYLFGRQKLHL